jgi:hypothetical protein
MHIKLHFTEGQSFSQGLVTGLIEEINDIYFDIERTDIENIREYFPELSTVAIDAARYRINSYRDSAIRVEAAKPGSLTIILIGSALSYWILQNTVGETFKETWKETDMHKKFKDFFKKGQKRKTQEIADRLDRRHPRYRQYGSHTQSAITRYEVSESGTSITVTIIEDRMIERIPTYEELNDKNDF